MGQYYHPIILADNKKTVVAWLYSHDYESFLKLREHSWIKNPFVGAVEKYLIANGPKRIVWAGDYADEEPRCKTNLYHRCSKKKKIKPEGGTVPKKYKYLINHSKNLYVDKSKVPSVDGWILHPLPLLTCEGNGQGGGDYCPDPVPEIIGSWARDVIDISTKIPDGYSELIFDLKDY